MKLAGLTSYECDPVRPIAPRWDVAFYTSVKHEYQKEHATVLWPCTWEKWRTSWTISARCKSYRCSTHAQNLPVVMKNIRCPSLCVATRGESSRSVWTTVFFISGPSYRTLLMKSHQRAAISEGIRCLDERSFGDSSWANRRRRLR